MQIVVDDRGWGSSTVGEIVAIIKSVHDVFAPCFGAEMNKENLLILHTTDYPSTFPDHRVILLATEDRHWSQCAYQFAHEYCHYQISGNVPRQLRWFEETLCELASYYFMPQITALWRKTPPLSQGATYADAFTKYILNEQKKATPFDLSTLCAPDIMAYFVQNEYDRGKNAYVALSLMPIFTEHPNLWSVIHLISHIPEGLTFIESLRLWHSRVPEEFRVYIQKIAGVFSLTICE